MPHTAVKPDSQQLRSQHTGKQTLNLTFREPRSLSPASSRWGQGTAHKVPQPGREMLPAHGSIYTELKNKQEPTVISTPSFPCAVPELKKPAVTETGATQPPFPTEATNRTRVMTAGDVTTCCALESRVSPACSRAAAVQTSTPPPPHACAWAVLPT